MSVASWLESLEPRSAVDPAALVELRAHLDDEVHRAIAAVGDRLDPQHLPLRLPKGRLADLERCERTAVARARRPGAPAHGAAVLRGTALDHFVTHELVAGRVREPVADLASMLAAEGDHESLASLDELGPGEAEALLAPLAAAAHDWSGIDEGWAPRVQSRAELLLGDGGCSCAGLIDVELGGRGTDRPAVLVEVKSGGVAVAHPQEAYLYGLLVALRDRQAPAVVARWYPGADPVGLEVTLGVLDAAAARLVAGVQRWSRLCADEVPQERAGAWCAWCPDRDDCPTASLDGPGDADAAEQDDDDGW